MKTFKKLRGELEEHPNLRTRIVKAINPMDKLRDKMDDLKKLPGKAKDAAIDKLKDTMDKVNPLSALNIDDTKNIEKKIQGLRKDKEKLTDKKKKIGIKNKTLTRQKKGMKK